ncbi:hypothetical protein ACHAQH_005810 [Verticillium albo-atrum]
MCSLFLTTTVLCLLGLASSAPGPSRTWDVHARPQGVPPKPVGRRSIQNRDTCPAPEDVLVTAPKANPFTVLSIDEVESAVAWLSAPSPGLNLTNSSSPTLAMNDNYIAHIEALKPNKTDILSYLDGNGTVPRYARVVLNEGALNTPVVGEYYVSVKDGTASTGLPRANLTEDYMYNGVNGAKVLLNGGFADRVRSAAIDAVVVEAMSNIVDITIDLVDLAYYGSDDPRTNATTYLLQNPYSTDDTEVLKKDSEGPIRELEDRLAPTVLALDGKRSKVDKEN